MVGVSWGWPVRERPRAAGGPIGTGGLTEEAMLRVTEDLLELRHWAEGRGGSPCRHPDGRIGLCFGGDPGPALPVGWDEFEATFCLGRCVFVYDDSPGKDRAFIGGVEEARAYVASADPHVSGWAGPTP